MFSKALLATDLSEASYNVAGCLRGLRAFGTSEVLLVHCLGIHDHSIQVAPLKAMAEAAVERERQLLEADGFQVTVEIGLPVPQVEINRLAVERNCSLIVVGSLGRTGVGEVLLGGVAEAVLHGARRPVMVARLRVREADGKRRVETADADCLRHVLCPTDFSDNAEHAFAYVEQIVQCGARRVTLLHVQDRSRIGKYLEDRLAEFNGIDQARLERLRERLVELGAIDVDIRLPYGSPTEEILKEARAGGASLLVMGSQGRGRIAEIFLGSVSHNVARHAPVSVLLVPAV